MQGAAVVESPPSTAVTAPPWSPAQRRAAWFGTVVAVVVFWLVATSGQPWRLFDEGPFTSDFYDAQAHALLSGRLDVPPEVATIEGFEVDGETHLYFGLGPALLRLPTALTGDWLDGRLTTLSQLAAVAVLALAAARLACRAGRAVGDPEERPAVVGLVAAGAALATPVLFLAGRGVVYHEAELWGAAAGLLGLELALAWWARPTARGLVVAGAVATFALACRPTTGMAPALALGLFALLLAWRRDWRGAGGAIGAAAVAGAAYAAVNVARFGSVFSVPWDAQRYSQVDAARQAALEANGGTLMGLGYLPTTLWHYLSPIPTSLDLERLFPFIGWSGRATVLGDATFDTIDRSGSLLTGAPVVVVLAVVGLWWVLRHDRSQGWRVIAAAALVGTAGTFAIGFIAHRYLVDLVPVVLVLAAPGAWVVARWLDGRRPGVRRAVLAVGAVVVAVGLLGQVALALRARYLYVLPGDDDRFGFVELQYDIDDRLFGGAPASVVAVEGALPEPTDGTVAILDGCAGLYRGDGLQWNAIEWEAGRGRRLVLEPDAATRAALGAQPVRVAEGDGWSVSAVPVEDGRVRLVYESPAWTEEGRVFPAELRSLDVVADPTTTQLVVRADGEVVLSMWYSPTDGLSAAPGWAPQPGDAPLCASLLARQPPIA